MTRYRIMGDPVSGHVAIFKTAGLGVADDEPLYDPLDYPERLQFHSGLTYPSTSDDKTATVPVTIPAQSANTKYKGTINLFEHGYAEPCMVEGYIHGIGPSGANVAFNGTVPVDVHTTGHATWLALGSTNTHIVLVYFGITYAARSALNLDITASAYDLLSTGPAPNPVDEDLGLMEVIPGSPPEIVLGRGRVSSRRRYIRKVDAGADFAIATGPTLSIVGSGVGSYVQNVVGWRWRYSVAGYVKETTVAWDGSTTDGGNYEAPYILVKQ